MRKRWFGLGAVLGAVTLVVTPIALAASSGTAQEPAGITAAAVPTCTTHSIANRYTHAVVRSTSDSASHSSTAWNKLACGDLSVRVPRGKTALVVVTVAAELACVGPVGQWCQGRVLINGLAGFPQAAEPSSFAWAHSDPSSTHWEANTMIRERLVRCPSTSASAYCSIPVRTEVRNHAAGHSFRVDDLAVSVVSTNT